MGSSKQKHGESLALAFFILFLALLGACAGHGAKPSPGNSLPGASIAAGTNLPYSPAEALARMAKAEPGQALSRFGREYDPALGSRVAAAGDTARLLPANPAGQTRLDASAYCLYHLNLAGFTGEAALTLDWLEAPAAAGAVWIGLGNWGKDCWDWFACPAGGRLVLPEPGFSPYIKPGTAEMLAVVMLGGDSHGVLHQMGVQIPALVDRWWLYQHDPQHTGCSRHIGPETPDVRWRFRTTGPGATFVSSSRGPDCTSYAMSNLCGLYAQNTDGTCKWELSLLDYFGNFANSIGQLGNPLRIGSSGNIYVKGAACLLAISVDGSILWTFPLSAASGGWYIKPVIGSGETVYQADESTLYAINPDGSLKWSFTTGMGDATAPALGADGTAYFCSGSKLFAVSQDGAQKWSYLLPSETTVAPTVRPDGTVIVQSLNNVSAIDTEGGQLWSTAVVADNWGDRPPVTGPGNQVVVEGTNYLHYLVADGSLSWSFTDEHGEPVIAADGTLFFCGSGGEGNGYRLFAFSPAGAERWHIDLQSGYFAGPILSSDGTLIYGDAPSNEIGANGTLHAISQDGVPLWNRYITGAVDDISVFSGPDEISVIGTLQGPGSWVGSYVYSIQVDSAMNWRFASGSYPSCPSIGSDGTVYTGCYDGNIYALSPDDGVAKWTYETKGPVWVATAVKDDGTIYCGSLDQNMYALSDQGALLWKYAAPSYICSPPAVGGDGTVYFGDYGSIDPGNPDGYRMNAVIYALLPDGTERWNHSLSATDISSVYGSPALDENSNVFIGGIDGNFHAFTPDGAVLWECASFGSMGAALGRDGSIYGESWIESPSGLAALNPDGSLQWQHPIDYWGYEPAIDANGTLYIGGSDGVLYAMQPDGTVKWSYSTGNLIYGPPVVDGAGSVYICDADAKLYALDSDGALKWTYDREAGYPHASPAIGNDGTLYIANGVYLVAIGPGRE